MRNEALESAFCSHPSAYRLAEGLIIQTENQQVHFPPLSLK